jgi:hypothetical protein
VVPAGFVERAGDCNDADGTINPGAAEVCDTRDNDCDTQVDEGTQTTFYRDADTDTYGGPNTQLACSAPAGFVAQGNDCNDDDVAVNPGAAEVCDTRDNNCNTQVDEGVETTFYRDIDGDTYGGTTTQLACTVPGGFVERNNDCNDEVATINPGATEVCDDVDNDCDGQVDEGNVCTCPCAALYNTAIATYVGLGGTIAPSSQPTLCYVSVTIFDNHPDLLLSSNAGGGAGAGCYASVRPPGFQEPYPVDTLIPAFPAQRQACTDLLPSICHLPQ